MQKTLLFIVFVFSTGLGIWAQTKREAIPPLPDYDDFSCIYKKKYTDTERKSFYPFNIAAKVQLVSFRYHYNNIPIAKNSYKMDSLREVKTLSTNEVLTLTDILYNNLRKNTKIDVVSQYEFQPRNAILFFDATGSLKEWILICFYCDIYKKSSAEVAFGVDCATRIGRAD